MAQIKLTDEDLKLRWRRAGRVEQRAYDYWMALPVDARSKDPSTPAGRRLAQSMQTVNIARAFIKAMTWAKDGQKTARVENFSQRPVYSTKSGIRPTWGAGRISSLP